MTILDDRAAKAIQEAMDARVRALSANHPTTHMAEVLEVDADGITWVHIFGGADRTPAIRTLAQVKKGDLVTVTIEDGVVTINGSSSNPAASIEYVEAANYAVAEYARQAMQAVLGDVLQVKEAIIGKATIEDLTAVEATIQTLTASYASINELVTGEFTAIHASIDDLEADNVTVNGKITAAEGRIDVIESDYITTADMEAEQARVGTLLADYAEIDLANVNNAWINNGVINKAAIFDANVFDITGQTATISEINAATINVTNLHTSNLTVDTAEGYVTIGNKRTPTKEFIDSLRDELQQEIDGAVETFTVDHVPLLLNSPATDWALDPNDYDTTEEYQEAQRRAYARHVGDIAYVTNASLDQNGYCYRFAYDSTAQEFKWVLIKDSDVTKALSDISDLQTFESETATWINETDQGLETIRTNHTTLSGVVDKTVKKSVQLWYTKANTTAPNKPTSQVTSTSTSGNAWRVVVPAWNASYPNYYYCWQYELADGTFAWSDVVRDIAMGESQSTSRNAQTTANSNIKSSVMLWFTKADDTAPNKPSSAVTTNNPATGNAWNLAVPTYNSSYPHYFYCYQQQKGDGTYQWTDVVYDRATSETQSTARAASSSLANYISTNDAALAALQSQVDGQLDVWYGAADPTVGNAPASDWDTDEKASHVGDLYYNTTDGSTWQWTVNGSLYSWTKIPDSAAAAALSAAQDAQATADGKRRIFTTTPTVPYDVGDLWVNGDEVKYATVAKTSSQSYSATDWAQTATDDTAAAAAQETANANIKSSVQLWFTKANSTAPNKPTAVVTTNNSSTANTWNIAVPTYNSSYPHYFYCYQQQKGDNTYQWTDVVYDKGTTEAMEKAQAALPQTTFTTFQQTTFKDVKDTVDEQSSTITTLTSIAENNGLTESTNLTNTVNTVQQTASTNASNISSLQTITTNNGLTSSTNITNRVSSVEQDLNGYKTTVSQTYATQEALSTTNGNVTAAQTDATNALNKQVAFSATSSTGATTAAKVASCTNFPTLAAGATVTVRFSTANTSTGAITLNVNSTGAKTVYVNGAATSSTNQLLWATNANITFTYDGTYWRVDSEPRTWYGTGGVAAATAAKTATINEIVICKGTTVVLNMTYENTNTSATLNVTSTGAKNIYYGTTTTRPTTANGYGWAAASTVSLVFDGTYWRIGDTTSLKRITTAESSITQTATSITSLVANNDTYTAPDGTTKTNTIKSAIKQNADAIDLRVEKSGVIAAINLTSETAKIQASKVEIDGTAIFSAISSDVDSAITGKGYATTGQVATAKSEAINSANSSTDTKLANYSTTTQMNSAISTAVDNIEVGGRNLLLATGTPKTSNVTSVNSSNYVVFDLYNLYAPYNQIVVADDLITVSFDWSCTATTGSFHLELGAVTPYTWGTVISSTGTRNSESNYVDVTSSNQAGHVAITFKATSAHASAADTLIRFRIRCDSAEWVGKSITISNAKAERGNVPTDWTPAPEDMTTYVDESIDNINVGGRNLLRFTTTPKYVGVYTLWTTDSAPSGWYTYRSDSIVTTTADGIKFQGGASNNDGFVIPLTQELVSDGDYVLTFDYRGTINSTGALYVLCRTTPNVQRASIELDSSGEWSHFERVVSWSGLDGKTPYALLIPYRNNASGWIEIRNASMKLEKGNVATDWTPAPEDTDAAIADVSLDTVEYIVGTQTAKTGSWTGVTRDSTLYTGKTIAYKLPYAGDGNASLQLKDSAGNNVGGNIAVYSMTTRVTTQYPALSVIQMSYDGTYWRTTGWYNTNDNARYVQYYNSIKVNATTAIRAASIIAADANGLYYEVQSGTSFDLAHPVLWCTSALAVNATDYSHIYTQTYDRTLATCYNSFTGTTNSMVFIVGTVNGNTFTVDSSILTSVPPTEEDGKFYIPIGRLGNQSNGKNYFNFQVSVPVSLYAFLDGKFRQVTPTDIIAEQYIYCQAPSAIATPFPPSTWIGAQGESVSEEESDRGNLIVGTSTAGSPSPTGYLAYSLELSEPLESETEYTLDLHGVNISNSVSTDSTIGIGVYYNGGTIRFGGWTGPNYFTKPENEDDTSILKYAEHLQLIFTPHDSAIADTSGGNYAASNNMSHSHASVRPATIRLYNFPSGTGDRTLSIDSWHLSKDAPLWTTKPPTYNSKYPVTFIVKQKKRLDGTLICTEPVKDDTTTIIDGGHIVTGTIDASQVNVINLDATSITSGYIDSERIDSSKITVTTSQVDGFDTAIETVNGNINGVSNNLSGQISQLQTNMDAVDSEHDDRITALETHVTIGSIGSGSATQPAIIMNAEGTDTADMSMVLTNTELSFTDHDEKVAWVSNKKMYNTELEVQGQVKIGKFAFIPMSDNSLAFKWLG